METEDRLHKDVLEALEAPPELWPHLDALLGDLPDLGTDPDDLVRMLRPLDPGRGSRVLDLGCGTGTVAVALARDLELFVEGVDGYEPFVARARARATAAGVATRCSFRHGDLRDALTGPTADVVVFGAVGNVLGDLATTVRRLREVCRRGGLIAIDHAFAATQRHASADVPMLGDARLALTAAGDDLVDEVVPDTRTTRERNRRNNRILATRARDIAIREPAVGPALAAYLERQQRECERLETELLPVLWLLRRV